MENKLSIKVNLAERFYPLKIEKDDEEKIRKAAKIINEKVLQYKQKYEDKDTQDFLAMAALQFVIKLIDMEGTSDIDPFVENIKDLEEELTAYLDKE
jgi:cell division protein ZapA (FtsZ GTPase activity inhibitor)